MSLFVLPAKSSVPIDKLRDVHTEICVCRAYRVPKRRTCVLCCLRGDGWSSSVFRVSLSIMDSVDNVIQ